MAMSPSYELASLFMILIYIIIYIGIPILIFWLIINSINRKKRGEIPVISDEYWYTRISLSKNDNLSQLFFLLSFTFLIVSLMIIIKKAGLNIDSGDFLLIIAIIGLVFSYVLKLFYILPVSLVFLLGGLCIEILTLTSKGEINVITSFTLMIIVSLIFYVVGFLHRLKFNYKRFGTVFYIFGLIITNAILFIFSTNTGLKILENTSSAKTFLSSWQIILLLLLFVLILIILTIYATSKKLLFKLEASAIIIVAFLFILLALLPNQEILIESGTYYNSELKLTLIGTIWSIFFNVFIFLEILSLLISSYVRQEKWLINLSTFILFLFVAFKYFDLFYTELASSTFFLSAGIFLFVVGWIMTKMNNYIQSTSINKNEQSI